MAREIHERENLLRDATALVPRAQLRVESATGPIDVFAGFRGDALSLYFGDDPVVHFDAAGRVRRAFACGELIKAERGRLVAMTRRRTDHEVVLERQEWSADRAAAFLAAVSVRLMELRTAIEGDRHTVVGEAPRGGDALPRLRAWLAAHPHPGIAPSARVS